MGCLGTNNENAELAGEPRRVDLEIVSGFEGAEDSPSHEPGGAEVAAWAVPAGPGRAGGAAGAGTALGAGKRTRRNRVGVVGCGCSP